MKNHIRLFPVFLLFLFFPFMEAVAGWNSFIINFDKSDYGKGAQTWQIALVEVNDEAVPTSNRFHKRKEQEKQENGEQT